MPLDFESVAAAGSMLGTRALQVFDETVSVVRAVSRWIEFYAHESCGKCTPCREGNWWMRQILQRLVDGQGQDGRHRQARRHREQHPGPVVLRPRRRGDDRRSQSGIKYFREEFEQGLSHPGRRALPAGGHPLLFAKESVSRMTVQNEPGLTSATSAATGGNAVRPRRRPRSREVGRWSR